MNKIYAVTAPGLAPYTSLELHDLGLLTADQPQRPLLSGPQSFSEEDESGGIEFSGDLGAIYRANLWLRCASRVIVRLGEFEAVGFSELRKRAARLEWERYLTPGQPVALRVTCHKSRLYHSDAVAERVAGAIQDRLGKPPPLLKFDRSESGVLPQLIIVRLLHDICTISIDTSGELLHRRGYRLATAKAPLRETLAAGILIASGWDKISPLLDPFCGSGTIAIEAALWALSLAPGRQRHFAFMNWPGFDSQLWASMLIKAEKKSHREAQKIAGNLRIQASDRDSGAIELAQANADRAGVADRIEFTCRAVSGIQPPAGPGWVVTNPPYGLRVSAGQDLRNLYAQFGNALRANCPGWQVAFLCSEPALPGQTGLKFDSSLSLVNGGVAVKLVRGSV